MNISNLRVEQISLTSAAATRADTDQQQSNRQKEDDARAGADDERGS